MAIRTPKQKTLKKDFENCWRLSYQKSIKLVKRKHNKFFLNLYTDIAKTE